MQLDFSADTPELFIFKGLLLGSGLGNRVQREKVREMT